MMRVSKYLVKYIARNAAITGKRVMPILQTKSKTEARPRGLKPTRKRLPSWLDIELNNKNTSDNRGS